MKFNKKFLWLAAGLLTVFCGMGLYFLFVRFFVPTRAVTVACCHSSYFSQPQFFDAAYRDAPFHASQPAGIQAIMVNHHLLAAANIAEAFNEVATTAPLTVLLISPNHFKAGQGNIIASAEAWQTPYGQLLPNLQLAQQLKQDGVVNVDESPFDNEHGVTGIVPFIKKSLPNAKVVPIIFNDNLPLDSALAQADKAASVLPAQTLIVGSFDFSHYLPSNAADFHDLSSFSDVSSFNFGDVYNLDMNSHPGLAFFLELLKQRGAQKFTPLEHSNSAKLTHQDLLETTSYITGYFQAGAPANASAQTLLSFGSLVPSIKPYKYQQLEYLDRFFYGQDQTFLQANFSATVGSLKVQSVDCSRVTSADLHKMIDAGGSVVICRDASYNAAQSYKGGLIIYANGALAVGVAQAQAGRQVYLFPIGNDHGLLKLLISGENAKVLADMAAASSPRLQAEIKTGIINF